MSRLIKTPSGEIVQVSGNNWSKTNFSSSKLEKSGVLADTSVNIQSSIQIYG